MTKRFKGKNQIFVFESDDIARAEFSDAVEDYPPSLSIHTKQGDTRVLYLDAPIDMQKVWDFLKSNDEDLILG